MKTEDVGEWNGVGKGVYGIDKARRRKNSRELESYPIFLGGFGLGPIADVSRTSPSRGVKEVCLLVGESDVRLGPVPDFALGPISDVSSPASSSGDSLVFGMSDVDGWFDVRGPEIRDAVKASPYWRTSGSITATARTQPKDIR